MNDQSGYCLKKSALRPALFSYILMFIVIVLLALLLKGKYGKQDNVKGLIRIESFFRIIPPTPGNVSAVNVKTGEQIKKGDILFSVSLLPQDSPGNENNISSQQENRARIEALKQAYNKEIRQLQEETESVKREQQVYFSQVDKNLEKISQVRNNLLKKKTLFKQQLNELTQLLTEQAISKSEIETLKKSALDNDTAIKQAEIEQQNIAKNRAEKLIYFARLQREIKQSINELTRKTADIDDSLSRLRMENEYLIRAPVDGVVHDTAILPGDFVDGKTPSVIIKGQESKKIAVVLFLTSKQIKQITRQQTLHLRVDSFPYEKFGMLQAKVEHISLTPIKISLDSKEALFRAYLNLDSSAPNPNIPLASLTDGMNVTTVLRQSEKNLLEWLFLPVKKAIERNPEILHD